MWGLGGGGGGVAAPQISWSVGLIISIKGTNVVVKLGQTKNIFKVFSVT